MKNYSNENSKLIWVFIFAWLLLVAFVPIVYSFIFLFSDLGSPFLLEPGGVDSHLLIRKKFVIALSLFALINYLIVKVGVKRKKLAGIFLKIIDPLILLIALAGPYILNSIYPCEGLGCMGWVYVIFFGSIPLVVSVLIHGPLLFLSRRGDNPKKITRVITSFSLIVIFIPLTLYAYLAFTLPNQVGKKILEVKKDLCFTMYEPKYLPTDKLDRRIESGIVSGDYQLIYKEVSGENFLYDRPSLKIVQSFSNDGLYYTDADSLLKHEGEEEYIIRGVKGRISKSKSYGWTLLAWIEEETEIYILANNYQYNSDTTITREDVIRIAESMEPFFFPDEACKK